MNSKAFLALFFLGLLAFVQGFGTLTTVAYNGALTIPLLSATAGTFGTAIALIGVLKLGAAALLLASAAEEPAAEGYEGYRRRHTRAAVDAVSNDKDALFGLIKSMDQLECGKSLICELEAKSEEELISDEILILSLFSDRKQKKVINPGSAKAEYDLAAELGLASKNQIICRQRFNACPYTADEMMKALRSTRL